MIASSCVRFVYDTKPHSGSLDSNQNETITIKIKLLEYQDREWEREKKERDYLVNKQ